MNDWQGQLGAVKHKMYRMRAVKLRLPAAFTFKDHDLIDFDKSLSFFDWSLSNCPVNIDLRICQSANYQALALLVPYIWRLRKQGCRVSFELSDPPLGASRMWRNMGGPQAFNVSINPNDNFHANEYKPLIAIRNSNDFKFAISKLESYTGNFDVEYLNTLRYVISELLYNTIEHGSSTFRFKYQSLRTPSIIQFTWYENWTP